LYKLQFSWLIKLNFWNFSIGSCCTVLLHSKLCTTT